MKIAVTGASGTIGKELVTRGCIPLECDITKQDEVKCALGKVNPNVLIHCAAITDVAYCEDHFKEAFNVNVRGISNLAVELDPKALLVFLSTDHVFKGATWQSGGYSEKHHPSPISRYGFSKWGGEIASSADHNKTLIVRTSKVYSIPWMMSTIETLNRGESVEFTSLIKRSFMYLPHFIDALLWIAENYETKLSNTKLLHVSGEAVYSYYQFWSIMQTALGLSGTITRRDTELLNESPRPFKAGLDTYKAKKLGVPVGSLELAIEDIKRRLENEEL